MKDNVKRVFYVRQVAHPCYLEIIAQRPEIRLASRAMMISRRSGFDSSRLRQRRAQPAFAADGYLET